MSAFITLRVRLAGRKGRSLTVDLRKATLLDIIPIFARRAPRQRSEHIANWSDV
jgi:hypothetical protein